MTSADMAGFDLNPAAHLTPENAARAHRHLVAKAIAEFTHERLLAPTADGDAWRLDLEGVTYRFRAERTALEHWIIDEPTLTRELVNESAEQDEQDEPGELSQPAELDALQLILELQPLLDIPDALLATYLEELSSTLASAAFKLHRGTPSAGELAVADFQTIETSMTEGHPGFVANNGRIGFGLAEHAAFAPESARPIRLVWLAARRELSHLALGAGLGETGLIGTELEPTLLQRFSDRLASLGLDPADYRLLPVHPHQWEHRVAITFAADLARRDLVLLGRGDDEYTAQQSVRTLFNRTHPERHYVKTAIAVQNMGFLRGLSPAYMRVTPAINDWVAELVAGDDEFARNGFRVLRERASIGYTGDVYHRTAQPNPHRKMLAALWRESPMPLLRDGERVATLASLLHRDADAASVVTAMIRASGLPATVWTRALLQAYLRPLVHSLLAHDLAWMPHGENLILVLSQNVPTGVFMKDIGEEIALLAPRDVPEAVQRVLAPTDAQEAALAIFTDVFDGVLRHLAGILHVDGTLHEHVFWQLVAECVDRHAAEHPDLESAIDLRAERFAHSCLNRLQLRNTLQMVDLANQSQSLIMAGTMANPIARRSAASSAAGSSAVAGSSAAAGVDAGLVSVGSAGSESAPGSESDAAAV
ncbi:desferrioxamine E synthetase DesD [Schumannella luteola]|uniref:Siderophore synthetase component n=1 Tax=Schumannella luteola TaxID=472059 RepID=A0A852YKR8_9MICO|nr:IucA/IucC family protein [Schumannella luteola]NYG98329.1 siderophore synthetase component [Schumannella luteola]TPX05756.1 IucA/IucC family siderophore biosynthesis protein [Schumannella luteola]